MHALRAVPARLQPLERAHSHHDRRDLPRESALMMMEDAALLLCSRVGGDAPGGPPSAWNDFVKGQKCAMTKLDWSLRHPFPSIHASGASASRLRFAPSGLQVCGEHLYCRRYVL